MRQIRNGAWRDAFFLLLCVVVAAQAQLSIVIASAAAQSEPGVFAVPPPSGDPAADLAAIQVALAKAKAWQAMQPKGADGLSAKVEVVLAPGTYGLCPSAGVPATSPGGHYCLMLNNWENLVVRGTGQETNIVLLDPNQGYISLRQSRRVTVANLVLDFKTVPFTQGRIVSINRNGAALASLDVQLDRGFATFADPIYQIADDGFLVIMDPVAARPKPGVPDYMHLVHRPPPYSNGSFARGELLADGKTWRLMFDQTRSPGWQFTDTRRPPIVPGDRFVYVTRLPNSGIAVSFCDTVTLAHLTFYAAGALTTAFVENSGPLLVDHLDIRIRPGSPRLISSNADGAHFQNNRGPITVQFSSFQGMADDAIAIYALATKIHQVLAAGENGKVLDYSPRVILPRDRLQILSATDARIRGLATITKVEEVTCPADVKLRCYALTLDAVPAGTVAEDTAYIYNAGGDGAAITHNVFRAHRGNGILLFGPHSSVTDNEFTEVPKSGIVIGPYNPAFAMGPVPDHIELRRNSFGVGAPGSRDLLLTAVIPKGGNREPGAIAVEGSSSIAITENNFHNPAAPAIEVAVGRRIDMSNNTIVSDASVSGAPGPAVRLTSGAEFSVNGLVVGPAKGITAAVEIGCGVRGVDPSRWTIQSGPIPRLLDRRPQCH